ncbi:hypothetical protein MNBD_GAMMA23-1882 [hydrothermal vent metagenome]|uniref:TonB C-terminal domain-containing protein n=1 Tax=hydrothermal vent metagenome TaxID=652676 RepID=A0A3B1A0A2_9ZZZZ
MSATLLIAVLLHGGLAIWLSMPDVVPPPKPVKQPLHINLLATIAETNNNVVPEVVKPPEPVKPKPEPVVEKTPVKKIPKPEKITEVVEKIIQPPQIEPRPATLDKVATARYEQLLAAWLEKHKKYPVRAKRLRIEGEGLLRILIDRSGQTRQVSLEQRTGNRWLDKAALAMAKRANPFPPMPEDDPRRELEFFVPVAFVLR